MMFGLGLVGDVADLIPFVTRVGETTMAIKTGVIKFGDGFKHAWLFIKQTAFATFGIKEAPDKT